MEWLDRLAEALGVEPLSGQEMDRLLRASRDVAHRVERKATPLAAFLAGVAVGRGLVEGSTREAAFDDALDAILVRLPQEPSDAPSASDPAQAGRDDPSRPPRG